MPAALAATAELWTPPSDHSTEEHHLIWPSRLYLASEGNGQLKDAFRLLECFISSFTDVAVHMVYHSCANLPVQVGREEMERAIIRHERKRCSCFREGETQLVNLLDLGRPRTLGITCAEIEIDRMAARIIKQTAQAPRAIKPGKRMLLQVRHDGQDCGCSRRRRAKAA